MDDRPDLEMWYENPWNYMEPLRDHASRFYVIWEADRLERGIIHAPAFMNLHLGVNSGWKSLEIGHSPLGYGVATLPLTVPGVKTRVAVLYEAGHTKPTGVFPVWDASLHAESMLLDLINNPYHEREGSYDPSLSYKPSRDQEHRIVITGIGAINRPHWKNIALRVAGIQREYPDVILHIKDFDSYDFLFNKGYRSVTVNPEGYVTTRGNIVLPSGKVISPSNPELHKNSYWLEVLGYTPEMLTTNQKDKYGYKRNKPAMISYNIDSLEWASRYYTKLKKFVPRRKVGNRTGAVPLVDWIAPEAHEFMTSSKNIRLDRRKPEPGDKVACDHCTLWSGCKYYREGSVCALPSSDMNDVAKLFGTRSADDVVDAMGELLKLNTERIADARQEESSTGELDPELTKVISSTLSSAEKLARLRDPQKYNPSSKTNVTINNQQNQVIPGSALASQDSSVTPAVAMHIINELEAKGYKREDITEDMIQDYLMKLTAVAGQNQLGAKSPNQHANQITGEIVQ